MLTISHISKSFATKKILDDVSFTIERGTLNAITGENGSGKTTLLRIIIGELRADTGSVAMDGKIGYSPQELLIFPMLTVEENFQYFATAYSLNKKNNPDWKAQRDMLLRHFNFEAYLKSRVDRLSGGTQQKLNLSLALLHHPAILILDEPYGGFDHESFEHFWELALQLRNTGKSILLVTHLLNNLQIFDRIFEIKNTRLQ